MRKKNIWYISKYAISPSHGNATRQYLYSKYFAKNEDLNVVLVSSAAATISNYESLNFDKYYIFNEKDKVKHYLLKGPKIKLSFSLKRIWSWIQFEYYVIKLSARLFKSNPPDSIIVSSLSILTIISGLYIKLRYGTRLILEIRDIWPLSLVEIGGYSKYNPFVLMLGIVEKMGYRKADAIVGTIPNLQEHVDAVVGHKEVHHIPHGIDLEYYVEDELSEKAKAIINKLDSENFNLVYVGSFGAANALELIFNSFIELCKLTNKARLHLIGSGPLKKEYINKYANQEFIIFHDVVSKNEVPQLLSHFDMTIASALNLNIYRYGISFNKLNEYLYCGKPSFFIYDGYKCVIEDADSGIVVSPEDESQIANKLYEVMQKDKDWLEEKGHKGKKYALEHLDYTVLAKEYLEIIKPQSGIQRS